MSLNVGIDVGSKELVVVVRKKAKPSKPQTFENSAKGHQALCRQLHGRRPVQVCLEATGVYHLDAAVALSLVPNVQLMVVNPKAAKRFAEATMTRTKTDAVDAGVLAEFAERMEFVPWQPPAADILALRACSRRLIALTEQRAKAKNQLHALQVTSSTPAFVVEDAKLSVQQLETQIEGMKQHTLDLISEAPFLKETMDLLLSVKGIGETSAIQLMGELLVLPNDMTNRQWVAMAGLDPRHFSSGTSVNKQTRISKVGNRFLRMALYMPALSAANHSIHVRAYYQHLINDNGLKKPQALCAVMRKLLHAIHGMLATRSPFDATRFYDLRSQTAS